MRDEIACLPQDSQALSDQSFCLQGALARVRTNRDSCVRGFDIIQLLDPVDIDDNLGSREPHVQQRYQTLPAGKNFAVVSVSIENLQRLLQIPRVIIFEASWFHESAFSLKRGRRTFQMA